MSRRAHTDWKVYGKREGFLASFLFLGDAIDFANAYAHELIKWKHRIVVWRFENDESIEEINERVDAYISKESANR